MSNPVRSATLPPTAGAGAHARRARLGRVLGAAFALLILPGAGHAFVRCVTTSQALETALADALSTADPVSYIFIAEGTYASGSNGFRVALANSVQGLNILGGYSRPGCETKLHGPDSATVLIGAPLHPTLEVRTHEPAQVQNIYIADLTVQHPGYTAGGAGACFEGMVWGGGHQLTLERVRIEQCDADEGFALRVGSYGTSVLRNVLVQGVTTPDAAALAALPGGTLSAAQLTVLHGGLQGGLQLTSSGIDSDLFLSNSVVISIPTNPFGWDIRASQSSGGSVRLERVHFDILDGSVEANIARSSGDAGFVSPTDPHLREDSLLVDSGMANPPGGSGSLDLDGNAREIGVAVDVGAFEYAPSTIFGDGFESMP